MSMPLSSGSFSSSSVRPARPPPNSVLNVTWKLCLDRGERLAEAHLRRLVDARDRLGRLRDRVDQVAPLRGQERVARLELVELLDGHHVHRAEAIDLGLQADDRFLGGHRCGAAAGEPLRVRLARLTRRGPRPAFAFLGLGIRLLGGDRRGVRRRLAGRSICSTSASTSSSEAWTASTQICARCVRSLSAVARPTSSSVASARMSSSARRASRMTASCASTRARTAVAASSAVREVLAHRLQRLDVGVERPLAVGDRRSAAPRGGRRVCSSSAAGSRCAARARARLPRAARPRRRAPTRARPAPHARRALRRPVRPAAATVSRASASVAAPRPAAPRPGAARRSIRLIDASASIAAAFERRALLFGAAALERDHLAFAREPSAHPRRCAPAAPRGRRRPSPGGAARRAARRSRTSPARSSSRAAPASAASRVSASRSAATRSRSSLISRRVARMPRDSTLAPPDTRCGPRSTSPSSVATGADVWREKATACSKVSATYASGSTLLIVAACGPWSRRTSDTGTMPGMRNRLARVVAVRARIDDHEAAAAGVVLANERQPGRRLVVPLDDDVLQQIAEAGLDRALVAAVDVEIVGHGALLPDVSVGLHEHHPRRVAEVAAAGRQLLERRQPRLDAASSCSRVADVARARARARRARSPAPTRGPRVEPDGVERARSSRASASPAAARLGVDLASVSRRRSSCSTSSLRSVSPTRSCCDVACCTACRSAVAVFSAAKTSVRAASTSPSSPSICCCARASSSCAAAAHRRGLVARALGLGHGLRRDSSAMRAGSRRASRSRISSAISVARAASISAWWRLNSCCCWRRLMSSSRACASSRIRDARLSASACSIRSRARSASTSASRAAAAAFALARLGQARPRRLDALRQLAVAAARTAPSPSAAARRAAACSGAPSPPAASACRAAFRPRRRCRRCG